VIVVAMIVVAGSGDISSSAAWRKLSARNPSDIASQRHTPRTRPSTYVFEGRSSARCGSNLARGLAPAMPRHARSIITPSAPPAADEGFLALPELGATAPSPRIAKFANACHWMLLRRNDSSTDTTEAGIDRRKSGNTRIFIEIR